MIKGLHAMFFTSEPEALRAFLRDKLGIPSRDVGGGWLIFDLPHGEIGCHPHHPGTPGQSSGSHDISFYCDDIEATVAEMKARGVTFADAITDQDYGRAINLVMPGDVRVQIYQPAYG